MTFILHILKRRFQPLLLSEGISISQTHLNFFRVHSTAVIQKNILFCLSLRKLLSLILHNITLDVFVEHYALNDNKVQKIFFGINVKVKGIISGVCTPNMKLVGGIKMCISCIKNLNIFKGDL